MIYIQFRFERLITKKKHIPTAGEQKQMNVPLHKRTNQWLQGFTVILSYDN